MYLSRSSFCCSRVRTYLWSSSLMDLISTSSVCNSLIWKQRKNVDQLGLHLPKRRLISIHVLWLLCKGKYIFNYYSVRQWTTSMPTRNWLQWFLAKTLFSLTSLNWNIVGYLELFTWYERERLLLFLGSNATKTILPYGFLYMKHSVDKSGFTSMC